MPAEKPSAAAPGAPPRVAIVPTPRKTELPRWMVRAEPPRPDDPGVSGGDDDAGGAPVERALSGVDSPARAETLPARASDSKEQR